ncbi:MAG TPA: hypothetical protein VFF24_09835 [Acidimicrobiia bacterium]|nr:hypothetical protein [Acidimicrobiia bacterium]
MPDEFDELARSLRQSAGQEWREEAAADEHLTELQRRRAQTLADVAREAMHRGDRVTVEIAGMRLRHPVVAVGADYMVLDDDEGVVDVALAHATMTIDRRASGGVTGRPVATTLRARLAELEQAEAQVTVVTAGGGREEGSLELVAADHLVIDRAGGPRVYVPLGLVSLVFSRFPPLLDRSSQPLPHSPGPRDERG